MLLLSVLVNFKEVWSNNTRQIYVNPHWTVRQFISTVKPIIEEVFRLQNYRFEIIEAGQNDGELALGLQNSDIPLKQLWGKNLNVSFYIRRKNYPYPQLQEQNIIENDCPVCLFNTLVTRHYQCSHQICRQCYLRCNQNNYTVCPICRSE
jgi:hypothetical protein